MNRGFSPALALLGALLAGAASTASPSPDAACRLYLDRAAKRLYVLDGGGRVIATNLIGIGKGGLAAKRTMADNVTPTGEFVVDLILYRDRKFDSIAPANANRWRKVPRYAALTQSVQNLDRLFHKMNGLDFDRDGKADRAYGIAYIGLDGPGSGPKMQLYHGTPYWFSIAIHGSTDQSSFGHAASGGCIHAPQAFLQELIERDGVRIGTHVTIADCAPRAVPR